MKTIRNVIKILKLIYSIDKKPIIAEIVCAIVENLEKIFRIMLPAIIIQMLTKEEINIGVIIAISLISLISVFGLVSKIMRSLLTAYAFKMSNSIDAKIREKLFKLDFEYSESEEQLAKHNMVRSTFYKFLDIDYLIINDCFGSVLIFIVMSFIIFNVNWFLYIVVLISSFIIYKVGHDSSIKVYEIENNKKNDYSKKSYFIELLYDIEKSKEIKLYNAENYVMLQYEKIADQIKSSDEEIERLICHKNIKKQIIMFAQMAAVYFNAIYKFAIKDLQLGALYIYVSAGTEFVNSVINIINSINEIKEVNIYFNDYDEYMNINEKMYLSTLNSNHISKIEDIEFQNVSFMYSNTNKKALENINCKISIGDRIALIGDNGAGKTTFIKLLLRLYDPSSGKILVNGKDIKSYNYSEYLEAISSVFQDSKLTGYSLMENIILDREYDEDRLIDVCEISGIEKRIKELEYGFESIVSKDLSDNGILFSGGEQQKISISRAIYKNDKNVILDEPTSAMDALAEKSLFEKMNDISKSGLIIYITHRLSNVAFCNKIFLFNDGKIIENGNHKELTNRDGKYKDMFEKQASFYS